MERKITFSVILLLASLACAVPGLAQPTAIPTMDANVLATVIAGTAQALAALTVAAAPTRTPTPTPTETPSPTPTTAFSNQGTALLKLSDGTTHFVDSKGGYELTIPQNWLALRINEQEFFDAWSLPQATDPDMQRQLTYVQGQSPTLFRLFAFDLRADNKKFHLIPNINVVWDGSDVTTLADELKDIKKTYPDKFDGVQDLTTDTTTTASGTEIGLVEIVYKTKNTSGEAITLYQKQAIYKLKAGTAIVTFSMIDNIKDALAADVQQVIASVVVH